MKRFEKETLIFFTLSIIIHVLLFTVSVIDIPKEYSSFSKVILYTALVGAIYHFSKMGKRRNQEIEES